MDFPLERNRSSFFGLQPRLLVDVLLDFAETVLWFRLQSARERHHLHSTTHGCGRFHRAVEKPNGLQDSRVHERIARILNR
jgi:hypothetical protein